MNTTQHETRTSLAGDLLVGADAIRAYLVFLGMPEDTDDRTTCSGPALANRENQRQRRQPCRFETPA